jgi:hypothetical protein
MVGLATTLAQTSCHPGDAGDEPSAIVMPHRPRFWPPRPFRAHGHEPFVEHPCGPGNDGPCIVLSYAHYDGTEWFLASDGRLLQYAHLGGRLDDDVVYLAKRDLVVTPEEAATILRASTRLPGRATEEEVAHAQSLLVSSQEGSLKLLNPPACPDGFLASRLNGFMFDGTRGGFVLVELQQVGCWIVVRENDSPAGHELASWVHRIRNEDFFGFP